MTGLLNHVIRLLRLFSTRIQQQMPQYSPHLNNFLIKSAQGVNT